MNEPRSGARVRPRTQPRHSRSTRTRWRATGVRGGSRGARPSRGFGPLALTLSAVLGLGAGVGTGWAVDLPTRLQGTGVAASARVSAEPQQQAPASRSAERDSAALDVPLITEDLSATGLGTTSDRLELSDAPAPPAFPASPALIDPNAVDAAGLTFVDRQAGLLSTAVPTSAQGGLVVVPGSEAAPVPDRPVKTIRVEVEAGLEIDGALFAQTVMAILNDPRGWGADGSISFARTDGPADLRVVLASPDKIDELCAPLQTEGTVSCGRNGHAALNHTRWVQATTDFTDRAQYRQYLVNHEVGHLLGQGHVECPGAGQRAPLMQQQSYGVAPCVANGWPFPDAA